MARTGSSSKFVPVNLNNSYGQTLPLSNGAASASSGLGRSRSFNSSYGGMVPLSRSTRVSSPSPSSATVSASSRATKLAVPRPMNLPSLRREHSGNDPSIALVGSSGSSGWTKQTGDETLDGSAPRSDALKADSTSWGNRTPPAPDGSTQITDRRLPRQSVYSPPGPGDASTYGISSPTLALPVEKAVVFRGEDFPTLQAAAVPFSPSLPPPPRSRDLLLKQRDKRSEASDELKLKERASGDDLPQSNCYFDQQFQPAQPVRMQVRGTFPDQSDNGADKGRGPSPLVKLTHTSNWADDERETLSSFRPQESTQSDWAEPNDGFRTAGNWPMDHSADIDFRRPTSRTGYPSRNDADSSMRMGSPAYGKDGDFNRGPLSSDARFELDNRGGFDRMSNSVGRNDFLKRGWSFSAAESNLNRDARFTNSNNVSERESYTNGRAFFREGNNVRHDTAGRDMFTRDVRPGFHYQDAGQGQESKYGKDVLLGRQGFPGGASPGPRISRGTVFSYNGSADVTFPSKTQPGMDYRRDKRASGFYGHVQDDDPFMGDGISSRPTSLYGLQPRMKKDTVNDHDYRDPARESFEAELERVEKMLEQERQRAVEERERAIELARKEQEEQERLAREEEEMRLKLEEEAREAAFRAQREAEDAARKVEEARKAREEEKRTAELEEERRKEAARKKLVELEERMAKREVERKREEARQTERGSTLRTVSGDASMERQDNGRSSSNISGESHWKSGKVDEDDNERLSSMVPLPINSSSLPSILRSPRLLPYSKEENGSSMEGARLPQMWKRETLDIGPEPRSGQKGSLNSLHLRNDRPQQEHEDRQWGSSFRNASVRKSSVSTDTYSRPNIDPDTADERNWWVRESSNKSQYPLAAYPQSADASEYPSYGRLRQSLPKQPRVLPPPPGPASFRKQFAPRDDIHSGASAFDTERIEVPPTSKEEYSLTISDSTVSHETGILDSLVTDIQVSEQFDSVPSEEVVLSDAGSQFSDDTIEEVVAQAYQEQELHSDAVSETYTEGEVDEISDLTEAQESSEDFESQKPIIWGACTGEQKADNDGESLGQARKDDIGCFQEDDDAGKESSTMLNKKEEELDECGDSGKIITSSCLVEDVVRANSVCVTEEAEKSAFTQSVVATGFKHGQEPVGNAEELASEKIEQDQEIQPFPYQAPFLPVGTGDAAQVRHLEDVSSRQSLVQQFQQPFSFMAVPLPQSSTLNHVGASVPMLTPVHGLPNQQELPFHVQLGLLPGMPLMPNAIQIGSIQMPLHIHPLAHVHGQQTPVFQFGQIGPSLSMSQPLSMTHMSQPAVQMHHAIGQVSVTQHHHSQADFASAVDRTNDSVDLNRHAKFEDVAAAEGAPLPSTGHNLAFKEEAEIKQGPSASSEGSTIPIEREVQLPLEEPETHSATVAMSKLDAQTCQKTSTEDTFESSWDGDRGQADLTTRPGSRPSRGGRRRTNAPRYQGILGRGRGRFHGGQNYFYQASHLTADNWPEVGAKRFTRGKMIRRNYRRAEYRVREPSSIFDGESAAAEFVPGPASNVEDSKESGGYRYVKRGPGSHSKNVGEENGQSIGAGSRPMQTTAKVDQPANRSVTAPPSKTKGFLRKYDMNSAEDAPFRTGVVCVFEQPGIETPNDKDDFIKVRSKRQLLRELREQREKESKIKAPDSGSRDHQVSKKLQRSSAKAGINSGMAGANSNKNIVKRRPTRGAESAATDGRFNTPSLINGATGMSSAAVAKRSLTSSKPGRAISASKAVTTGSESIASFGHDNHNSEQSTTAAWGGQRSNQEVVSLTQIQFEEAMKPFRLDAPFSESTHVSEKVLVPLEPGLRSLSALTVEKTVITSGPLSSLLAGEKIQFGAVTSPTPIPPNSRSSTPLSTVRTGSPLGFGSDSSHVPGHTSSFVTNFLESPLDAAFSSKGDSASKDDGFEGKVADLELEAEAEAAASAVVAAAISSEDPIESHSSRRVSEISAGCTTLTSANPLTAQIQNNSASDNPMAVALPADLSVETPPSLFQGSSMSLSNLSGVMLQSLPSGAPTFPFLEMGPPLIGGPVFNFGPREDASLASLEPGLSGWQQRHVGTPDSFYGAPPFLSPAGLSSIQGHPHMLVYANPYTPVGQFGQLGVSFMGASYHPSGKQPDWTHIPLSSASSGALALNDGDLSSGSNGVIVSQHLNGASNLIPTQRTAVAGTSVMSVAAPPPNLFDAGLAAPFQVDGFVQSHWSKAPAPPVHSVPISGSSLPIQNIPLSRPVVDLNMQIHSSRVFPNQAGHLTHLVDASNGFHQLPVLNPVSGSSFSSADAHFPDELGLGDSMPTVNTSQSDAGSPLPEAGHVSSLASAETTGIKMQRGRRPSRSSQGNLSGANGSTSGELTSTNPQDQSRSSHVPLESQSKNLGRIGTPSLHTNSLQSAEQRASKQALPRESAGGEWPRSTQRKGASGRLPTSDRGGSVLPSKLKQIYVAKPVTNARKLSAACS